MSNELKQIRSDLRQRRLVMRVLSGAFIGYAVMCLSLTVEHLSHL